MWTLLSILTLPGCRPDPSDADTPSAPSHPDGTPPETPTPPGSSLPPPTTPPPPVDLASVPMPPGVGTGRAVFVATDGDDRADGTAADPVRTIAGALRLVEPGSIVSVAAGTYDGALVEDGAFGTEDAWVRLTATDPADPPVIVGGGGLPALYFYADSCDEENGLVWGDCAHAYWRVDGVALRGDPRGSGEGYGVKIDTPHVQLVGNDICCTVADLIKNVRTGDDTVIVGNALYQDLAVTTPSDNAQGIDITGADRVVVRANWLHDLTDIAAYAKGNARDTVFDANRIERTGLGGEGNALMCGQSTDAELLLDGDYETYGCTATNNLISDVAGACLAVGSSQGARMLANTCVDTGTSIHAPLFLTNESEIGTRSTDVEIRGTIVVQTAGREVFTDSDRAAVDDWSTITVADNLYATDGDPVFSVSGTPIADGGDFAGWSATLAALGAPPDTSAVGDPGLDADLRPDPAGPAVDVAPCLVDHDQQGAPRPLGAGCDVGALEQ